MARDYFGIIQRKVREQTNPLFVKSRRQRLNRCDFSIISNNCWGGSVYRYFGLPYQSPTAGLYFFASDYVRFSANLRHYLASPLEFIDAHESLHWDVLKNRGEVDKPIALIDDIEIVFLHYSTAKEAAEKWYRRVDRLNWNNLFIKFSQMNSCTEEDLRKFDEISFPNKLCFTATRRPDLECAVFHPASVNEGQILNDTDRFSQGLDLYDWLNREPASYPFG